METLLAILVDEHREEVAELARERRGWRIVAEGAVAVFEQVGTLDPAARVLHGVDDPLDVVEFVWRLR